jgi:hypothetical protein
VYRRAVADVGFFAEALVGEPLWAHQFEVVRSAARYRVICAGRQVGKSRLLAVMALHDAMRGPGRLILVVSAGEEAAKRLLAECAALAMGSPLIRSSVIDDQTMSLTLDNGSIVRSVPASERQIRGWAVDLLIVDEAGFVSQDIWRAAEPSIIARPGSRVVLSSSPWGGPDHFFRRLWERGMREPDVQVESWHWPSSISPLVDAALLEEIRRRENPLYYEREYEATWTDQSSAFFSPLELDGNVAPYTMLSPPQARDQMVVVGVDWGVVHDASTLVALGVLSHGRAPGAPDEPVYFVAAAEERFGLGLNEWARHIAERCDRQCGGFSPRYVAAEINGVGSGPVETLRDALRTAGHKSWVTKPVWTDNRRKVSAYGVLKLLLQQGRLVLPANTALRRQLASVEMRVSDAGNARIEVPSNVGHDDLADALMQAAGCVRPSGAGFPEGGFHVEAGPGAGEVFTTGFGVEVREQPRCLDYKWAFQHPKGAGDLETGW